MATRTGSTVRAICTVSEAISVGGFVGVSVTAGVGVKVTVGAGVGVPEGVSVGLVDDDRFGVIVSKACSGAG